MLAYRESLESLSVYHKVNRSFMHTSQDLLDHEVWFLLLAFFAHYAAFVKLLNRKLHCRVKEVCLTLVWSSIFPPDLST